MENKDINEKSLWENLFDRRVSLLDRIILEGVKVYAALQFGEWVGEHGEWVGEQIFSTMPEGNAVYDFKRDYAADLQRNDENYVVKNHSGNYVSVNEYLAR